MKSEQKNIIQMVDEETNGRRRIQRKIVLEIQEMYDLSSAFSRTHSDPIVNDPLKPSSAWLDYCFGKKSQSSIAYWKWLLKFHQTLPLCNLKKYLF